MRFFPLFLLSPYMVTTVHSAEKRLDRWYELVTVLHINDDAEDEKECEYDPPYLGDCGEDSVNGVHFPF